MSDLHATPDRADIERVELAKLIQTIECIETDAGFVGTMMRGEALYLLDGLEYAGYWLVKINGVAGAS